MIAATRADLLRVAMRASKADLAELAPVLGFRYSAPAPEKPPTSTGTGRPFPPEDPPFRREAGTDLNPAVFYLLAEYHQEETPELETGTESTAPGTFNPDMLEWSDAVSAVRSSDLTPWPDLAGRLFPLVKQPRTGDQLDIPAAIRLFSRSLSWKDLPRKVRRTWPHSLAVIIDRHDELTPFWQDQNDLIQRFERLLAPGRFHVYLFDEQCHTVEDAFSMERGASFQESGPVSAVLVVADCLKSPDERRRWAPFFARMQRRKIAVVILSPGSQTQALTPLRSGAMHIPWVIARRQEIRVPEGESFTAVRKLLFCLCAPAILLEPGLLREIRRLLPAEIMPADIERRIWADREVKSRLCSGLVLSASRRAQLLETTTASFEAEFPVCAAQLKSMVPHAQGGDWLQQLKTAAAGIIKAWHAHHPPEIWLEEVQNLYPDVLAHFAEDKQKSDDFFYQLNLAVKDEKTATGSVDAENIKGYLLHFNHRNLRNKQIWRNLPAPVKRLLDELETTVSPGEKPRPVRDGVDLTTQPWLSYQQRLQIVEAGNELLCQPETTALPERGSPLGSIDAERAALVVTPVKAAGLKAAALYPLSSEASVRMPLPKHQAFYIRSDRARLLLRMIRKPAWASASGRDRYGLWAELTYKNVTQRLRWIPPGEFLMGSPPEEKERYNNELQHRVQISSGYWLFDTQVTQALWQAVMETNPSRFKGPNRPVETVSWDDCQAFISKLNERVSGLDSRLPTEAEWEYACRAGTTTPFNTGENLTTDQANYDGNYPYRNFPKGKDRQETTQVGSFPCNAWGLYDMHGNVDEWCADWYGKDYYEECQRAGLVVDPQGPSEGSSRVLRGGRWSFSAVYCRSAYRFTFRPGYRGYSRGCRLLGVPQFS